MGIVPKVPFSNQFLKRGPIFRFVSFGKVHLSYNLVKPSSLTRPQIRLIVSGLFVIALGHNLKNGTYPSLTGNNFNCKRD